MRNTNSCPVSSATSALSSRSPSGSRSSRTPSRSQPAARSFAVASAIVSRGKGSSGTTTRVPQCRSICSPCRSATRSSTRCSIRSSKDITSSTESIHANSTSTPVNSVACREVKDGSARNTGPISKTRSMPAAIAICL